MSIDPRTIKTILQLQLAPSLDFQSTSSPLNSLSGNGSTTLFDSLLSQYMSDMSSESGTNTSVLPMEALSQLSGLNGLTNISYSDYNTNTAVAGSGTYDALIQQASSKYGVDPSLIQAVIKTESGFDPNVQSHAGAKGLMQLMDGTARGLGVTDSFDPAQNIDGGTKYLSLMLRKYNGNEQVALAAYNAGPGRIDRLGIQTDEQLMNRMNSLPEETQRYVSKVLNAR